MNDLSIFEMLTDTAEKYWALSALLSLGLGFFGDLFWARWSAAVAEKRAFAAANWSGLIYICGLFYFLLIVDQQFIQVACYFFGSYLGTYLGVCWQKPEEPMEAGDQESPKLATTPIKILGYNNSSDELSETSIVFSH